MFAFLSKKIAIPNNLRVDSISWSSEEGYIVCGGEKGLLKILKLDDGKQLAGPPQQGGNLSMNQTLEGHSGSVKSVIWNERFRKLTTCDENGLIIVWMMHKNSWFEEMINNRNKSQVVDMKWSPDGQKICIIYEDGAVILGGVEGSRIWGKEYKHKLHLMEWSPDGKLIVFGTPEGEVRIYDSNGAPLHQLKIYCMQRLVDNSKLYSPDMRLASIQWYEGSKMYTDDTPAGLIIAYECGRVQLMKNDKDDDPILIDTTLTITAVRWNNNGTIFAISGIQTDGKDQKGLVQFYNNQGIHLKTLKIPQADKISCISWEGSGLRLAMVHGYSIYFANVKSDYKWGYLTSGTLVFAYQKSDRIDFCVIFWDTKNDTRNVKYVKNLVAIRACGEFCILVSKVDEVADQFLIVLCNGIGSPLDSKYVNIEPLSIVMTKTHIILASNDHIYSWQYKNQVSRLTTFEAPQQSQTRRIGRESAWFIDETPNPNMIYDKDKYQKEGKQTEDIINCLTATESALFVGRNSGSILKFTIPHITLESKLFVKVRPYIIRINCDATRIAVVDSNGILSLYEVNSNGGNIIDFEKKDVWEVRWAAENPIQFAFMEKSRMYTVKGTDPEEPIQTDAYLCHFADLQIRAVLLDEIMKGPDVNLKASNYIIDFETKSLRDTRDILNKVNLKEAYSYIEQNAHPKLWRLLVEKSLDDLDFVSAEKALLKCDDYQGLQMIKRVQQIDDKNKQRAEILTFYGKMDEAENLYKRIERKDLAIQLRMKLGDWFKVVEMIKEGTGYDDVLQSAYKELGNYYADRFKWAKAAHFHSLAKNYPGMIESFYNIEDFESLEKIIPNLPEGSKLLIDLGDKFQLVGLCENAVKCYERAGDIKKAIDCCVLLNHWNLAVELAEQNNFVQIEGLLTMYATHLLEKKKKLEAAELYRKANKNHDAAKIFSQIAQDLILRDANPLFIKKLFVMAALEVDLFKKRIYDASMTGQNVTTAKTLESLITSDINTSTEKMLNNPWRGAEAWHFYLLAQKQLYNGEFKDALKTSMRVAEYELELDTRKVYSLIALAGYYSKNFKECSKAFVKLEGMKSVPEDERERYENIAVAVFSKNPPNELQCETFKCVGKNCSQEITEYDTHCKSCGSNFQPCVATGKSIVEKGMYTCKMCKHKIIEEHIRKVDLKHCPLCHGKIVSDQKSSKEPQGKGGKY